ncbi:Exocyst component protein [Handroanthus impetiginosus]|uniref:Exocyst subunit Exo70 family protein n=1 Tax=Handroanthus impetiginosus TaxID=429701 RepID=A0A2G9GGB1_9LAMI|nr:Exocyst component protein [Handroanthus impetiginosus]
MAIDTNQFPPPTFSHTFYDSMMQENIGNAEIIIRKWDPNCDKFTSLFQENRKEAKEFIKCVENLRRAMHFLIAQNSSGPNHLVLANKLMKVAMLRLEKELHHILSTNGEFLSQESLSLSNSDEEEDDQKLKMERDVKIIAESMISSGYSKECGRTYRLTRKSVLDEQLYRLGIRNYIPSQINRLDHEALKHQVNKWINSAKVAIWKIFHGERLLCDQVFHISETIKQTCIAHIIMEGATNLFKFPEIVAKSKRYPDKIFLLMKLHEAVSNLWPEIESIFSLETLSPIKLQGLSAMHKLRGSAQKILSDFVSTIRKNSSKTAIPGGGIHPLTCSVMNYLSLLADNNRVLSEILDDDTGNAAPSPFPESYFDGIPSPITGRLAWIILFLLCKLDSKSELYKDIGLSYLFLANNLQFIAEKVRTTALKFILGENWLSKLQKKVKLFATNYESVSWAKVFASLAPEIEESPCDHFQRFNSTFKAAYEKQSLWVVPDPKVRDEIRASIERKMVPAYRELYNRYLAKNMEIPLRFSPENLGDYLSELFERNLVVFGSLSSSSSNSRMSRCL